MTEADGLQRFLEAQDQIYPRALDEIRKGRKRTHWMWFIFPQIKGLGRSAMAQRFAIASADEAKAYLAHPVLGSRFLECVAALQDNIGHDPVAIFGQTDALKLRSSLTLFEAVGGKALVGAALDRWFDGERDETTIAYLGVAATE